MRRILFILSIACMVFIFASAQEEPKRELRSVWVASVSNIDWPKFEHRGDAEKQKAELIRMLDLYKAIHLNAIFLQVRPECDALYNSSYEPWSRYLTGSQGTDPGYDPLQFAIEEAHKRGIEVHTWLNPYRINASTNDGGSYYDSRHIYREHPEWAIEYPGGRKILNPGLPEVMSYIGDVVEDIVSRYNLDGVHFDDYFYSYDGTDPSLDAAEYEIYGNGMSLGDWRRDNVNRMIDTVYSTIQKINPNLRFGVSPFGIWRSGVPPGIVGLDAYSQIYCDPLAWLEDKTVDYITPQQYWPTGGGQDFETLTDWWSEQCFTAGRHHIPGHGTYRLSDSPDLKKSYTLPDDLHESKYYFDPVSMKKSDAAYLSGLEQGLVSSTSDPVAAWTLGQIGLQIDIVRSNRDKSSMGSVFFSAKDMDRVQGLAEYLAQNKYTHVTLMPEMTWKNSTEPIAPSEIRIVKIDEENFLEWDCDMNPGDRFAIYTSLQEMDSSQVIKNPINLRELSFSKNFPLAELDFSNGSNIVITTVTPTGKESLPSSVFTVDIDLPIVDIISPEGGDTVGFTDKLVWESEYPEALYRLEISPNINFSNLKYVSEWVNFTEANIDSLSLDGETFYYWRVRAKTDTEGPYSRSRILYTGFPAVPGLISPENLSQSVSTRPLIKWDASPAAGNIHVFISESANFEPLVSFEEFDASRGEGKLTTELAKNTWYYVRIQALNNKGVSDFSEFKTFKTTSGEIPDVVLLSPQNGETVASYDELKWETTATEGTVSYSLEIALDNDFNSIMSSTGWINKQSIQVSDLILEGQRNYYWRVKGKSEYGESDYSGTRSFTAGYPKRPSLTAPVQLSENNSVMVTVAWQSDENTDTILVQFAETSEFASIEHSEKFISSQSPATINHSLKGFTWYFARIQALNEYGGSIFSSNKYFKTGESNSIIFGKKLENINIFPNPYSGGRLYLQFGLNEATKICINVYDELGRTVLHGNYDGIYEPGKLNICLDKLEDVTEGIYIIEIQTDYSSQKIKLVKLAR